MTAIAFNAAELAAQVVAQIWAAGVPAVRARGRPR